ncbi:hypothetical protein ABTL71_19375, partial [Acinetobacter baumannii]
MAAAARPADLGLWVAAALAVGAVLVGVLALPAPARARPSHCAQFDGAMIMVDKKFLGKLADRYDALSIFNRYGNFG